MYYIVVKFLWLQLNLIWNESNPFPVIATEIKISDHINTTTSGVFVYAWRKTLPHPSFSKNVGYGDIKKNILHFLTVKHSELKLLCLLSVNDRQAPGSNPILAVCFSVGHNKHGLSMDAKQSSKPGANLTNTGVGGGQFHGRDPTCCFRVPVCMHASITLDGKNRHIRQLFLLHQHNE